MCNKGEIGTLRYWTGDMVGTSCPTDVNWEVMPRENAKTVDKHTKPYNISAIAPHVEASAVALSVTEEI